MPHVPTTPSSPSPEAPAARRGVYVAFAPALSAMWLLLLGACAPAAAPIEWTARFECTRDSERSAQVVLGIATGGCPAESGPLYEVTVSRDGGRAAVAPGQLAPGRYGFYARALDSNGAQVAQDCVPVDLPSGGAVELLLRGAGSCSNEGDAGVVDGEGNGLEASFGELVGPCERNEDCGSGFCCTSRNCGGGMCTLACTSDRDCPTDMLCEHETCFQACASNDDCPGNWSCEHEQTVCEAE